MKKELEEFYDTCDSTIKSCTKASGISVMDLDDPEQAVLLASCMRIYNDGKQISLSNAEEFDDMKKLVKENNELIKELLRKVNFLENKKAKEKE